MNWSYQFGRIGGIPLRVHISFLIFMGYILLAGGGLAGAILMLGVFGSVVLHELGHAWAARKLGLPIVDISLYPFGGMARLGAPPRTTTEEIWVAAIGPAVSFLLAFVLALLVLLIPHPLLAWMARINLMLGLFNLLPALPMDGGRIVRAIWARKIGFFQASLRSARLARWIALGLFGLGFLWSGWLMLLAVFLFFLSSSEEANARARAYMGDPGYHDLPEGTTPSWRQVFGSRKNQAQKSGTTFQREVRDRFGNRITIEWEEP